jgi:hypothetical protein
MHRSSFDSRLITYQSKWLNIIVLNQQISFKDLLLIDQHPGAILLKLDHLLRF